jgi:hypothetical protein
LFLLFGLVESLEPDFFRDRMFPALAPGDYNADGVVDAADYNLWRATFGSQTRLAADGNKNGVIDAADYAIWRSALVTARGVVAVAAPEPGTMCMILIAAGFCSWRCRTRRCSENGWRCSVTPNGLCATKS